MRDRAWALVPENYKWRKDLYWVTSREDPEKVWLVVFKDSAPEVQAFRARSTTGHPCAWTMDADECIAKWHEMNEARWALGASRESADKPMSLSDTHMC